MLWRLLREKLLDGKGSLSGEDVEDTFDKSFPEPDSWALCKLNEPNIPKNLTGALAQDMVTEYVREIFGELTPGKFRLALEYQEDDLDGEIKTALEDDSGGELSQAIDLIGRLNHLACMISVVAQDKYAARFSGEDRVLFGAFGQMKEAVLAVNEELGWNEILKDYDQSRARIWYLASERGKI